MSTLARTDPHRPSVLDPSEYVMVGAADNAVYWGKSDYIEVYHDVLRKYDVETGTYNRHDGTGVPWYDPTEEGRPNYRCHHCGKHGTNIRYFVFFLHKPTSKVVVVGKICAKKLSLASKDELDLEKRADAYRKTIEQSRWVEDHPDEVAWLNEYHTQHQAGGIFNEFYDSLYHHVERYQRLTQNQHLALRNGMSRPQPWQKQIDGDRHQGRVVQVDAEPTEAQLTFLRKLLEESGEDSPVWPVTRSEASDLINRLKGQIQAQRAAEAATVAPGATRELLQPKLASEKQLAYIAVLLKKRDDEMLVDEGLDTIPSDLTMSQARKIIDHLLTLPEVE